MMKQKQNTGETHLEGQEVSGITIKKYKRLESLAFNKSFAAYTSNQVINASETAVSEPNLMTKDQV